MEHFNINPTIQNSKPTWYVSFDGNDTTGDGSITNPYRSIAMATSVGASDDNIVVGNGIWEEQRTLNGRYFNWYGNGLTWLKRDVVEFSWYTDTFYFFKISGGNFTNGSRYLYYCHIEDVARSGDFSVGAQNCVFIRSTVVWTGRFLVPFINNICIDAIHGGNIYGIFENNIIIGGSLGSLPTNICACDYNNYTDSAITTTNGANAHSINDASTGQTVADYFNNYDLEDFTAKAGSANLGAGKGRHDIGFSLGFNFYATDDAFLPVNGATLRNVTLDGDCFIVDQRDKGVSAFTSTTFSLGADASSVDDYYNGLVYRIVEGTGLGEMAEITDYDGATRTFTVASFGGDLTSRVSVSGYIESGQKDFGSVIKVKRNFFFGNLSYNEANPEKYTEYASINPDLLSFGLKFSDFDDLGTKDWYTFMHGRETYKDASGYGDGDDLYTISEATNIHLRYCKIKFNLLFE